MCQKVINNNGIVLVIAALLRQKPEKSGNTFLNRQDMCHHKVAFHLPKTGTQHPYKFLSKRGLSRQMIEGRLIYYFYLHLGEGLG